jgi:hypothetical protein
MKSSFSLPLVLCTACLVAWFGARPQAFAGPVSPGGVALIPPPLVIPPPHGSYTLTVCDYNKQYCSGGANTPVSFSRSSSSSQTITDGASTATGLMDIKPSPGASAFMKTSEGSSAFVLLTYWFGVTARSGLEPAPVTITAQGKASASATGQASAYVNVQDSLGRFPALFFYQAVSSGGPSSFSASKKIFIAPNTLYAVTLSIDLTVDEFSGQNSMVGQAAASVDPIIAIDPEYAAGGYRLLLSRNVGNVPTGRRKRTF